MEYRQLGSSGLMVSALSLGTATFGGVGEFVKMGNTDLAGARRQIDMCLDAGVNLFDSADAYSAGRSEEILGAAIEGRRERLLIATKLSGSMGAGPNDAGLSRHHVISACEASLRRLNCDHIDLYQLHGWDGLAPLEETLAALDLLVRSGKVRYVGVSNFAGRQLMKALGIAHYTGLPRFVVQQIYYSLHERAAEFELIPLGLEEGVGTLVWSPLAGGLLSGRYRRGVKPAENSRQLTDWGEPPVDDEERLYDTVEVLVRIAARRGVPASQVAIGWLLSRPTVASVILGARTDEQLAQNLGTLELSLSASELAELEQVSRPPLPYPYWHQVNHAADRFGSAQRETLGPWL